MALKTNNVVYLIAGEASGDALGAKLMEALRQLRPNVKFHGVGGERMQAQGLISLFPLREISYMGFAEVVPHIPAVLARVRRAAADIRAKKPAVVVTIDAQSFSRRVAMKLQSERKHGLKLVQYVAPTVWAYKPERAAWFKALYDHMLCLLPFEPPFFETIGMPNSFVGHPVLEEVVEGDGPAFRQRFSISSTSPLLGLFPGSRRGELHRLLPLFRATVERLRQWHPHLHCAMLVLPSMQAETRALTLDWPAPLVRVGAIEEKTDMLAACDVALSKSGTITLELALAQLPTVVAHKVNPLSMWLIRRMIRIRFATLVNLLQQREIIPELLQEFAQPEMIAGELQRLFGDPKSRELQKRETVVALQQLMPEDGTLPSHKAAHTILEIAGL